jgi:hypothetical protein
VFCLAIVAAVAPAEAAWPEHPRGYVCYRASESITIDGRLDEGSWRAVPWTQSFRDIQGPALPKPLYRTRAKMLWDDEYLYIGAELQEPHVWATLTEHDSIIFQDPDFEIFIDPDGDNHDYYEIEINALNTEWDLRLPKPYRDGGPALNEWEIPGLKTAVHVDGTLNYPSDRDHGWTVEMALPWKVLGEYAHRPSPPSHGDQWRINFSRVEWQVTIADGKYHKVPGKPEDNWVWSAQEVIDMHRPERWGYVQFSTDAPAKTRFRRDPSFLPRMYLMRVYYAQVEYHKTHGRYAESLSDLGSTVQALPPHTSAPTLSLTAEGYEATVTLTQAREQRRLYVRQDSKLWES